NFFINNISTGTDLPMSIEEVFSNFEQSNSGDLEVYSEMNKEDLGDRIIVSKAYKIDTGYLYYNFIDFKDSEFYVLSNYSVAIEGKFEDIKEELDKMAKSIKIKEDTE
ncbi:MAG: hypothetical protein K2F59_06175, partial [Eubacteriales bacterium]|nr:hypothetical protein [Eubacteriales bacterium]